MCTQIKERNLHPNCTISTGIVNKHLLILWDDGAGVDDDYDGDVDDDGNTGVVNEHLLVLWDDGDDDDYDDDVDDVDDVDDDSETGVVNGHLLVLWGASLLLRIRPVQVDNLI